MSRISHKEPILASLLDRLIDDEPGNRRIAVKSYGAIIDDIKDSIRRDLEFLLNTRLMNASISEDYPELACSIVNYGLPDFSGIQLGSMDGKEMFREQIQNIIERFEPRFNQVVVEVDQIGEKYERTLFLQISAILMIEPDPIPLFFDSRVKTIDKSVHLREVSHG